MLTLMPIRTMASSTITTIASKAPLIDMVQIPAGTYELGGKNLKATLTKGYYIGEYEVTHFVTIRDYGKQKLLVNASGQKSHKGTKVIVWSSTGSAPDNGKITLIKD
ncbi:hypothetical protein [Tissierella sp.]|uniref:hypothetical protein n=1 Tax=Tissierella sp. TaxID=41274 RepID=UPI00286DDDA6|nr:hypothetical protein [Tissierella sp.]